MRIGDEAVEPLRVLSRAELARLPAPTWAIDGIVPEAGLVMVYGAPASFKSFIALDMALSIATGRQWHGRAVKPSAVTYVAAEGKGGMGRRVLAWETLRRLPPVNDFLLADELVRLDLKTAAKIIDHLDSTGSRLVVVDTWARVTEAFDENSANAVSDAVEGLDTIRRLTGATIIVVHHSRKDGQGYRGSSALGGAVDMSIVVKREKRSMEVTLACDKAKDVEEFQDMDISLEVVRLNEEDSGESSLAVVDGLGVQGYVLRQRVCQLVRQQPGQTSRELAPQLNVRRQELEAALELLAEDGELDVQSRAHGRREWSTKF
jgi:hypothetical protein